MVKPSKQPNSTTSQPSSSNVKNHRKRKPSPEEPDERLDEAEVDDVGSRLGENENDDSEPAEDEESDMDGDAPRAVAWQDDEGLYQVDESDDDDEVEEAQDEADRLRKLQRQMASLPFGTLLQARKEASASEDDDDSSSASEDDSKVGGSDKAAEEDEDERPKDWKLAADRKVVPKRLNKTAPVAITSKKPVSRFRQVIDVKRMDVRDPRFSTLSGDFDEAKFTKRYSFITDIQKGEAKTLRKELREAKKGLEESPHWKAERRVDDLKRTLNRTETMIKRRKQGDREREILSSVKKEERAKRESGKGAWHMKDSDKRKLLLEAKFTDLAEEGGQRKIKRVLDKKQKLLAQKEKRARPYAKGEFYSEGGANIEPAPSREDRGRRGRKSLREGGRSMQIPMARDNGWPSASMAHKKPRLE